ncbi:DUF4374 domain-containing protein [Gelidibacter maritimus]|uniref:DUF4374 domain-containing protein n=1 Tax=Gelidibacter maritimus TaxID=2761487 RepID=A0A7W2R4I2_9FLAO|nr:DUF4374 domain-containing protein [Gelidibacter maritimus]MBA6153130.1 DUF4374 domain-containing protein [Gelidibacter maritimus]
MRVSKLNFKKQNVFISAALAMSLCFYNCSSDDSVPGVEPDPNESGFHFFVSAEGESAEYLLTTDNLEEGNLSIAGNGQELEQSGYTWICNDNPSAAIGLIYQQGDPGVGLGYNLNDMGQLNELGQFQITSRFTSYGFFNNKAITSVGGQTPVDSDGNSLLDDNGNERSDGVTFNLIDLENNLALQERTITTLNIVHEGEQATLSGIVDLGNGEFLTGLVVSKPKDPNAGGGSSTGVITYPDSVWVAKYDANLILKTIYRDDRISYSSGRFRSQYYSQIGKSDNGDVYVFSGSYDENTTHPAGALKIDKGADAFDAAYYFNIQELSDGYKFRKVHHITKDYFLLEFYNDIEVASTGAATQYGIVKMEDKIFNWLNGMPSKNAIVSTGLPASHEGKLYFPITVEGENPAIYSIDPVSATATKGISVMATNIRAVGVLSY